MSSKIPAIFKTYAQRFNVDEGDFRTLETKGIGTIEAYFFNVPNETALEKFLVDQIYPVTTTMSEEGDLTSVERAGTAPDEWICSAAAGSLRQLWECAKIVARKDLEDAVSQRISIVPRKINAIVLQDMIGQAVKKGMPQPLSRHLPGPLTLSKVVDNLSMNGPCKWIDWSNYVSRDDEDAAIRLGFGATTLGLSIVHNTQTGLLTGVQDQPDIRRLDAMDLEIFRNVMTLRSVAHRDI